MPPRQLLNTDAVRQLFQKYGYTITEPTFHYRNQSQKIHVRNDLTYGSEYWSVKQLKYKIDKGKLVEIDPFLHTVLYSNNEFYQTNERNPAANFARKIDMDEFINENARMHVRA